MTINSLRNILYTLARLLGDVNAIKKGKIGERILRRSAGRITGKFLQKIFRKF
ncbi:hypothetical protein [Rosettibacter firmus]|uniref:hypothetical protein n=1 Tax=Rosettibacter firmus TaxID=3111522 RepID=UPI00336C1F85